MPKKKMMVKTGEVDPRSQIKFHKALLILLASLAGLSMLAALVVMLFSLVLDNPLIGIMLLFLLVPIVSGFIAGRYVILRDTWFLGLLGGGIWSGMEIGGLLLVLFNLDTLVNPFVGRWEVLLMGVLVASNCIFCLLGCRISAKPNALMQFKEDGDTNG